MRLTNFSDFSLRLLMYAAAHQDRLITIEETSEIYNISRGHLMKIANTLTRAGYLKAVRGRSGGLALAKPPGKIRLGEVFRVTEPDFNLVECFAADSQCVITRACRLRGGQRRHRPVVRFVPAHAGPGAEGDQGQQVNLEASQ